METNYKVYKHTSPSGKVYIGLTKQKLEDRWRSGKGYKTQVFGKAVRKYGWENIESIIIAKDLSAEEASELEATCVRKYNSDNKHYGYNITSGGELSFFHNEEILAMIKQTNIDNGNFMLDYDKVTDMRNKHQTGMYTLEELAGLFNTTYHTVCDVLHNKTWIDEAYAFKSGCSKRNAMSRSVKENSYKMDYEKAKDIRTLHNKLDYTQKDISEMYGVSRGTVNLIVHNKIWYGEDYQPPKKLRKLNKKLAKEMRDIYKEGYYNQTEIANLYNTTSGTVSSIIRNDSYYDRSYKPPKIGLNQQIANKIRKIFKEGVLSQADIARKFGVSSATISNIIKNKVWVV
jgi:DNA-binding XRE family transcriptional regulator